MDDEQIEMTACAVAVLMLMLIANRQMENILHVPQTGIGVVASVSGIMDMGLFGWSGSVHDARVFKNSPLFNFGAKMCSPSYLISGDAAYPLKSWLLVPYWDIGKVNAIQRNFNFVHATRCTVERAFAVLKCQFRRLKYLEMKNVMMVTGHLWFVKRPMHS